jgi:hypothetical protein
MHPFRPRNDDDGIVVGDWQEPTSLMPAVRDCRFVIDAILTQLKTLTGVRSFLEPQDRRTPDLRTANPGASARA